MLNLHNGILVEINESFVLLSHKILKVLDLNIKIQAKKEVYKEKKGTNLCLNKNVILFQYNYSCLAGESVHFFDEVHELSKIPEDDCVGRIYMTRHIIEKYIVAGLYFHSRWLPYFIHSLVFHKDAWLLPFVFCIFKIVKPYFSESFYEHSYLILSE